MYSHCIHPHDEMLTWLLRKGRTRTQAFSEYLASGYTIYRNIGDILAGTGRRITAHTSLLDFASGYGRLTRFLVRDAALQNITVSDIIPEAVRFQTAHFGVNGVVSTEDPRALTIGKRFDVITCISMFSHLPEASFAQWLTTLLDLCAEDGILIFTTHPLDHTPDGGGARFRFVRRSESRLLHPSRYGTSFASYRFVDGILRERGIQRIICYIPKGLNKHQDIYVAGPSAEGTRTVTVQTLPCGCIDAVEISGDEVRVSGWAYDPEAGSPVREARIYRNEKMIGRTQTGLKREDVAKHLGDPRALHTGFSCACRSEFDRTDTVCAAIRGEKTSNLLFYRAHDQQPLRAKLAPAMNALGNLLNRLTGRRRP